MSDEKKVSAGNVEIDVAKYTEMVLKLDEAQDKIKEMEKISKELQIATAAAKPKERFSLGALFRDENDINEKAIIGFASFFLMRSHSATASIMVAESGMVFSCFLGNSQIRLPSSCSACISRLIWDLLGPEYSSN